MLGSPSGLTTRSTSQKPLLPLIAPLSTNIANGAGGRIMRLLRIGISCLLVILSLTRCNLYSTNYDGRCHHDRRMIIHEAQLCAALMALQQQNDPNFPKGDKAGAWFYGCGVLLGIPDTEGDKKGRCDNEFWAE